MSSATDGQGENGLQLEKNRAAFSKFSLLSSGWGQGGGSLGEKGTGGWRRGGGKRDSQGGGRRKK